MEEVTNKEVEQVDKERSRSLEEEETIGNETLVNSNTVSQDQIREGTEARYNGSTTKTAMYQAHSLEEMPESAESLNIVVVTQGGSESKTNKINISSMSLNPEIVLEPPNTVTDPDPQGVTKSTTYENFSNTSLNPEIVLEPPNTVSDPQGGTKKTTYETNFSNTSLNPEIVLESPITVTHPQGGTKSTTYETNSNISLNPETVTVVNSNKITYYSPIQSIVGMESPNDKESIKETYKLLPKSVPSSANTNPNLSVLRFECENFNFTSAFDKCVQIGEIKKRLCYILELEEDFITFYNDNNEIKDSQTLVDFENHRNSQVTFRVLSTKGEVGNAVLKEKVEKNIPTLDVITVHIDRGEFYRDVVVEIGNEATQKQWLGGYRNNSTRVEYHNAETQTSKKKKVFDIDEATGEKIWLYFERDTQTPFPLIEKTVNTMADKAIQMSRSDLFMTSKGDKIISYNLKLISPVWSYPARYYIDQLIVIQRAIRQWILRKKFKSLIQNQTKELRKFKEGKLKIKQDQEEKERAVTTGAVYPVNRDDFYALFLRVEKWWGKEWKKICENKVTEAIKAASVKLIEDEITLLQAIEKHKVASKAESLKKVEMRFLEQLSRPVLYRTSKGHLTTIDYMETQTAREFKEIYSCLTRKDLLPKDRIEILIRVKKLFESGYHVYEYSSDIVSLINREIQLIGIGLKSKDLEGLHSRIEQLFLNFIHEPEFNPAARKYKKPNLPKTVHGTYQCTRCMKLLPVSKYSVHVRLKRFSQCKSCIWMHNIAHQRADMSPYLKLLHQVQNSEMEKCCYSAICFILQPIGMGHLTNLIWHGRSAISECSDISQLHHVRWLPDVEWAPWNTILLTEQEAKLHESIPDVFTFYDQHFIEKVRQKHILARKDFIPLLMVDYDLRSTKQWSKITDSGVYLHPSHGVRISNDNPDYDVL